MWFDLVVVSCAIETLLKPPQQTVSSRVIEADSQFCLSLERQMNVYFPCVMNSHIGLFSFLGHHNLLARE